MQDLQTLRRQIETTLVSRAESDATFRAQLISNPKAVLQEAAGLQFGEDVQIEVHEETPRRLHLVIPVAIGIDGELSDENLEAVAGGGSFSINVGDLNIAPPSTVSISPASSALVVSTGSMSLGNTSVPAGAQASNPAAAFASNNPGTLDISSTTLQSTSLAANTQLTGTSYKVTPKGVMGTSNPSLTLNMGPAAKSSK